MAGGFVADHVIRGLTPAQYEQLYFDEPFNEALCQALHMRRRLTQRDAADGCIERRVEIRPQRDIPAMFQKLLAGRQIAYTEHATYRWGSLRGQWVLEPAIFADRVHGAGFFDFAASPGGCRRRVGGDLKISWRGLGGLAERLIVAEVRRSYDAAAAFTQAWVDKHPPA